MLALYGYLKTHLCNNNVSASNLEVAERVDVLECKADSNLRRHITKIEQSDNNTVQLETIIRYLEHHESKIKELFGDIDQLKLNAETH